MILFKAVCFDLDDTLIREIHSVMLPCILNGKEKEHSVIQEKEETGELDYITADHLRAELLLGLDEAVIAERFLEVAKPLKNISETINTLHSYGIKCLLITVGPLRRLYTGLINITEAIMRLYAENSQVK